MNEADKKLYSTDKSSFGAGISAVLKVLHYLFVLLSFGIVGVLVWYFSFGGAFTVEEQERVLVMNFGKLSGKPYEPGWHWNWPYPISEIVRIRPNREIRTDLHPILHWLRAEEDIFLPVIQILFMSDGECSTVFPTR